MIFKDKFTPEQKQNLSDLISKHLQLPYFTQSKTLPQSPIHSDYHYYAQFNVEEFTVKALVKRECCHASHMEIYFQNKFIFNLWPSTIVSNPHLSFVREPEPEHLGQFEQLLKACDHHYKKVHSLNYLIHNFSMSLYSLQDNDLFKNSIILFKPSFSKNKKTLSIKLMLSNGEYCILQKNGIEGNYQNPPTSEWDKAFAPTFEYRVRMSDKKRMNIFNPEINEIMESMECFKEVNKSHRNCEIVIYQGKIQTVRIKKETIFQRE